MVYKSFAWVSLLAAQTLVAQLIAEQAILSDATCAKSLFQTTEAKATSSEAPCEVSLLESTKPIEETTCGKSAARPMRISMRHIEGNGVGYNQGYTTLEGFFSPIHPGQSWVPFLELRGHVFNNGKLAANAGLGMRYVTGSRVYGANAYYDYRNTKHQHYNQVSLGLEALGRTWDFRINGYLPVGAKTSRFYRTGFEGFEENYVMLSRKREVALKGANAEVGYHVDRFKNVSLYFAAGPYYLTGKGRTSWGGEARAVLGITDYVSIEGNTSYDSLFQWIGQGQVSINIPFGPKHLVKPSKKGSCGRALSLSARALQCVDRNEIIPVDRQKVRSKAIDPATGNPYFVLFVDNTSHSAGTFESPFPTLLAAQNASGPNDIIYIFPGDQTTTGMDNGIVLQDGQRLWGSALAHSLPTTVGTIQIPALSFGSFVNNTFGNSIALLPIITGPGNVVTVANNNEISGIYILNTAGNGITGSSISNLTVVHSTIQGTSGNSIALTDLAGNLIVDSNVLSNSSSNSGIDLVNTTQNLDVTISNNHILSSADAFGWDLSTEGMLQFTGNTVFAEFNAVNIIQGSGSSLVGEVSNNQMQIFQHGVFVTAGGADALITMESNAIDGGGSGPAIEIDQTTGSFTAFVKNNQVRNYGQGFLFTAGGNSTVIALESNIITPGAGNPGNAPAVEIDQTTGSLTATISSNQTSSSGQGFLLNAGGVSAVIAIQSNIFNAGIGDGNNIPAIEMDQTGGSLIATLSNNQTVSANQGVLLHAGGLDATVSLSSNTITSYYGHGIDLEQTAGTMRASVNKNTIAAQDNNGFNYKSSVDPTLTALLNVTDNTISGYQPIVIEQDMGSTTSFVDSNTLSSNYTGPGITIILNAPSGTQVATLSNNIVSQTNGDGFLFFYDMGNAVWSVNANTFNAVGGNAVRITPNGTTPNASICVEFNDNIAYPIRFNGQGTYLLENTGNSGTFTLNPPMGNIGDFTNYTGAGVVTGTCP